MKGNLTLLTLLTVGRDLACTDKMTGWLLPVIIGEVGGRWAEAACEGC